MAAAGEPRCIDHTPVLAFSGSDEEHKAPSLADAFNYLRCSSQMCGGDIEGDYVYALMDAEDVALILRFPEGRGVAQVSL
jgi:hypothetical protein